MVRSGYGGIRENTSRNTHNVVDALLAGPHRVQRVLDVPCGEGAFTRRLKDRGISVCGGDCVNQFKAPDAEFVLCDMNQPLPFPDREFDAVVCIDGIEHIERPFDFIRETHRVLRREGLFLISTPNISALRSRWRWLMTGFHNAGKIPLSEIHLSPLHHIGLISFPELRYMLHSNGFRIDRVTCNRIKFVSWPYAVLVPFAWLATCGVFLRQAKDAEQRRLNREILRQIFSMPVLFGETLIVRAVRGE